jgi:NAD(P)-dependent dehydrogenase (short-subunit alcohol dehydrogenase family)
VIDHGEHSYRGHGRLKGLTALVTDADSGLGRAVAIAFAREGANVGLTHLNREREIAETAAWVQDCGRQAVVLGTDGLDGLDGHEQLAARAGRELGRIHILVDNRPFEWLHHTEGDGDVTDLERAFRTSLESAFQLSLAVSARMADGGSIIITAPMRYAHPVEPVRALAANGHGMATLAAGLAQTLAPKRIRVNVVVPGPVYAPRLLERLPSDAATAFGTETLQGRAAQPVELAPAFVFLSTPAEAAFVNGTTLEVTGGAIAAPASLK